MMAQFQSHRLLCYQFAYNDDNYGFLLHDPESGQTAAIDAGCDKSFLSALAERGLSLSHIFITHHHWDHTDGLAPLKEATGATVYGPRGTKDKIAALIDVALVDGDEIPFANDVIKIIATPGHTLDMINFYSASNQMLFSGDSLFVLGCGRLFEGDGPMMHHSLSKLLALPDETVIYSAHEYALGNAAFAETIEPDNLALRERITAIRAKRDKGEPCVPSTMAEERATNPFCRADSASIAAHLGMQGASEAEIFTEIRRRKDVF